MLPKAQRLHSAEDILTVIRKGKKYKQGYLSCYILKQSPLSPLTPFRLAVVISQKVSKKAVIRNLQRRRIYAILQEHPEIMIGDMVVRLLPGADRLEYKELEDTLLRCLSNPTHLKI